MRMEMKIRHGSINIYHKQTLKFDYIIIISNIYYKCCMCLFKVRLNYYNYDYIYDDDDE